MKKTLLTLVIAFTFVLFCINTFAHAGRPRHLEFTGQGADCARLTDDDPCFNGTETWSYSLSIWTKGSRVVGNLTVIDEVDEVYPLQNGRMSNKELRFTVVDGNSFINHFSLLWISDNELEGGVVELKEQELGDPCEDFGLTGLIKVRFWLEE
jgi:hypothetical protein